MKSTQEIHSRLRDLVHRHRKKFFRRNIDSGLSKEDLQLKFKLELKDPERMVREYRDVAVLMWCLGYLDNEQEEVREKVLDRLSDDFMDTRTINYTYVVGPVATNTEAPTVKIPVAAYKLGKLLGFL